MISVYNIKPLFQKTLNPSLTYLHKKKISANQITLLAFLLSIVIAALFFFADHSRWLFLALPAGLLVRMALNALDGMMARIYNQISQKGELYNEVGDVVSDVIIFLPLLKFFPQAQWPIIIFICMGVINEFVGVMGKIITGTRRYEGPMGKSDRALVLGVLGILMCTGLDLTSAALWIFIAADALLLLSTCTRFKKIVHDCH